MTNPLSNFLNNSGTQRGLGEYGPVDSPLDAFRHVSASAMTTLSLTSPVAQIGGDFNEWYNSNNRRSEVMDQYNNFVGRQYGESTWAQFESTDTILNSVAELVGNGVTINDLNDPRIDIIEGNLNPGESLSDFFDRTGGIVDGPQGQFDLQDPRGPWQNPELSFPPFRDPFAPDTSPRPQGRDFGGGGDNREGTGSGGDGGTFWDYLKNLLSPLVIDLDGDGIELTQLSGSHTFFDLNIDGFAERTGWVQSDDGLLAIDANGNGIIDDNSELFGNQTGYSDGFQALADLDSNSDGVIDANDTSYASLLVWQDSDQDGVSDDGELRSLADVGIISINLNATAIDETNSGHWVSHRSEVTFHDGQTTLIEDVHFETDQSSSIALLADDFQYHPDALNLPVLWSYGQIASTWVALSGSDALRTQAIELNNLLASGDLGLFKDGFVDFLYEWAGVANIDPNSRGSYVDARKLAFLEKMFGSEFLQQGTLTNPQLAAGQEIEAFFDDLAGKLAGRFAAQSAGSYSVMNSDSVDEFLVEFSDHPLNSLTTLLDGHSPEDRSLSGDLVTVIQGLENAISAGSITVENAAAALQLLQFDLSSSEAEFSAMVEQAALSAGLLSSSTFIRFLLEEAELNIITGTESADTVTGNGEDLLVGYAGNDSLVGSNLSSTFDGGIGDDTIVAGDQADLFVYRLGDGNDLIKDHSYLQVEDRLLLADVTPDGVTFSQNNGNDLVITFANGDQLRIEDHFHNDKEDMEIIEFADGTVLNLQDIRDKSVEDQKASGYVRGSSQIENYVHEMGDGSYTIADYSFLNVSDTLTFTDVASTDVTFVQTTGMDLQIHLPNGEVFTIIDHFHNTQEDMEVITFADGVQFTDVSQQAVVYQSSSVGIVEVGTFSDDVMSGDGGDDVFSGLSGNDNLLGGDGNDTLNGGRGIDALSGGAGNDYLIGGVGDDVLTGGSGADTFEFGTNFGNDHITDFQNDIDRLYFVGTFSTWSIADILSHAQEVGEDVVFSFEEGDLTAQGTTLAEISDDIFV